MTIVEVGRRRGDADHGLLQQLPRKSHRSREGASQKTRKIAIAVVGEAPVEAVRFVHFRPRAGFRAILTRSAPPGKWRPAPAPKSALPLALRLSDGQRHALRLFSPAGSGPARGRCAQIVKADGDANIAFIDALAIGGVESDPAENRNMGLGPSV